LTQRVVHDAPMPTKVLPFFRNGALEVCDGMRFVAMNAKLGSHRNSAPSCKAILEDDWSAPSGAYYIQTDPTVTKVYCYMKEIPGCGGGGWTTVMKTNGHMPTFRYDSAFWRNKTPYHVTGGQSGADHQETKLPTYWTLPFTRLCLGMKSQFQSKPNWIRLNYKASSLYSVIADNRYRRFTLGRNRWKSLIPGSSLQKNCNQEGFNSFYSLEKVRIGILSNQENDCKSPDSRLGFGGAGTNCGVRTDDSISTGNKARCGGDNGNKVIKTLGYILAQ
ncbi:hypothetical protein QZH41_014315, partial [Actinostola sp. cb2023]